MISCKYIKSTFTILFLICYHQINLFAQLIVAPNNNAAQLAETLKSPGTIITNATINCPQGASGTFDGTNSDLNIANGILLTTGQAILAVGPNSEGSAGFDNQAMYIDSLLIAVEPQAKYDVCILEFDATSSCDTLGFTFSFGSEEYLEFVNGGYNDVFGIFVTGANPAGAAYVNYNVALIPSTTTTVSIDNINTTNNPNYYVANDSGKTVQYDGFTKPINAWLRVVACTPYHFKLVVADAGDAFYDSGVFFSAYTPKCSAALSVTAKSTPYTCGFSGGTATVTNVIGGNGPYSYFWSTHPVQTTVTATGLAPGSYTVVVIDSGGCLNGTTQVAVIDSGGIVINGSVIDASTCFSNDGAINITTSGGNTPYSYFWSNGKSTASISGLAHGNYKLIVADAVGCKDTTLFEVKCPSKINEYDSFQAFSLSPNPTAGSFIIKFDQLNMNMNDCELMVYNVLGKRVVYRKGISKFYEVDISSQPEGIYFVQVRKDRNIVTQKVVLKR